MLGLHTREPIQKLFASIKMTVGQLQGKRITPKFSFNLLVKLSKASITSESPNFSSSILEANTSFSNSFKGWPAQKEAQLYQQGIYNNNQPKDNQENTKLCLTEQIGKLLTLQTQLETSTNKYCQLSETQFFSSALTKFKFLL